eukprot:758866-Rhodomonas_salina.2
MLTLVAITCSKTSGKVTRPPLMYYFAAPEPGTKLRYAATPHGATAVLRAALYAPTVGSCAPYAPARRCPVLTEQVVPLGAYCTVWFFHVTEAPLLRAMAYAQLSTKAAYGATRHASSPLTPDERLAHQVCDVT